MLYFPLSKIRIHRMRMVLVLSVFFIALILLTTSHTIPQPILRTNINPIEAVGEYGRIPLHFEANQGQVGESVEYLARGQGYNFYLTNGEATLVLSKPVSTMSFADEQTQSYATVNMQLLGANPELAVVGQEKLPGVVNYFIGNDPEQWQTNIATYAKIQYENVYPGIDLVYYGNQEQLEYDFVVQPGVDPHIIALGFDGADSMQIDPDGNLVLDIGQEQIMQQSPFVYQEINGERHVIESQYDLSANGTVSFTLGEYDHTKTLIIDPILVYATYLGGLDTDTNTELAVDSSGNVYVTGYTYSDDFPVSTGAFDTVRNNRDAYVMKFDNTGTNLLFATFIGGSSDERGRSLDIDANNDIYLTGDVRSTDFPVTTGAYDETRNSTNDAFVLKLDSSGSSLHYSTYLGGGLNDFGHAVMVDATGQARVVGITQSADFPTTPTAFDPTYNGGTCVFGTLTGNCEDVFAIQLDATGSTLLYGTYYGGVLNDYAYNATMDSSGNVYIMGYTYSVDLPTTVGAYDNSFNGGDSDAFVAKINATGTTLSYATYLGGSLTENPSSRPVTGGIAVDNTGNAYVTGLTYSSDFPTTAGAFDTTYNGSQDPFVTKLDSVGNIVYSTFVGGVANDFGAGIDVDSSGNAYITGNTISADLPVTSDAFQPNRNGQDAYLFVLDPNGQNVTYGSYLGGISGAGIEIGGSLVVDNVGDVYIAGITRSTDFPATIDAFDQTYGGGFEDGFIVKISLPCMVTNLNNAGVGSLRTAINCANSNPGSDTITFQVAGTINVLSQLPTLSDTSGGTLIDGTTAPSYAGVPIVEIQGPGFMGISDSGIKITSANNTVKGLQIRNFSVGIEIIGSAAIENRVFNNYLGTDGVSATPNRYGLTIKGNAFNNFVGTDGDGNNDDIEGNVISGNENVGIETQYSTDNIIAGNFIGTDASGENAVPNMTYGIQLSTGSNNNYIGTNGNNVSDDIEGNLISGNNSTGIRIYGEGNIVAGNYIGTNTDGTVTLGNGSKGLFVVGNNNLIGTNGDGISDNLERNLISGNPNTSITSRGIEIGYADGTVIAGNYIGIDATGTNPLGNHYGIRIIDWATNTIIGTNGDGIGDSVEGNVISGNYRFGIDCIFAENGTIIAGNLIGSDATGLSSVGNGVGISVDSDTENVRIGTNHDGTSDDIEQNLISGNINEGIIIQDTGTTPPTGVTISDNLIGTDISGQSPLGNGLAGIKIYGGTSNNLVEGNTIAFNGEEGVSVYRYLSTQNKITENQIFSNGALGIDLTAGHSTDGQTPNDSDDTDIGGNNLQNYPSLVSADLIGNDLAINGTLNSTPNITFTLEFFANSACDVSGYGEGERFIGTYSITTDGSGTATFSTNFATNVAHGESITATATDPNNNTSEFSACVIVAGPNEMPIAVDDSVTTDEDVPVSINVLANDTDNNGDILTVPSVTQPTNGTAVINLDYTITYTPTEDFYGSDSFIYTVDDSNGGTATAIVSLTITAVNDAPEAVDNSASTLEDTAVTIDVLANDLDVDGDSLTTASITQPANGTAVINLNNTITYTPTETFSGLDSFSYVVTDGVLTDTATVTVTVNPIGNWFPMGLQGVVVRSLGVSPSWPTDPTIVAGSSPQPGTFYRTTNAGTSWWSTQPLGTVSYNNYFDAIALSPDYQYGGNDQTVFLGGANSAWVYLSTDSGESWYRDTSGISGDKSTWDFAVSPAFATDGTVFVAGNNGVYKSTDSGLTFSSANNGLPGGSHLALAISSNYLNDQTLFVGTYYGAYKSTDGGNSWALVNNGLSASGSSSYPEVRDLAISPDFANDQTIFSGVSTNGFYRSMDGGASWEAVYLGSYGSVGSQSLSISPNYASDRTLFGGTWAEVAVSQDGGETWQQLDNTGLSATAFQAGVPDVVISPNFSVDHQLFIGTSDGVWAISLPDNSVPEAIDDIVATDEDTAVTIGVLTNDSDIDGDSLTVTSVTQPTNGTSVINLDNTITYTPTEDFYGSNSFIYTVDDSNGGTATAIVSLTITAVNDAPEAVDNSASTLEDTAVTIDVLANDLDVDGDSLTTASITQPANGTAVINLNNTITYTPTETFSGIDSFSYVVSDSVLTDTSTISVTVNPIGNWFSMGLQGVDVRSLAISPFWPTDPTIVAGSWYQPGTFYRTTNAGASWWSTQPLGTDSYSNHFDSIALSPDYQYGGSDQTVFLGGGNQAWVYLSTNSGESWYRDSTGISGDRNTWDFAVSPTFATDGIVFVAGNNGVHKSTDNGLTFSSVNSGLPGGSHYALAISPNYSLDQTLFVGNYYGVYKSTDGGGSWTLFNNGLSASDTSPYPNVYDLTISPNYANDHMIFAGVYTKGIYRSTDNGSSWNPVYPDAYVIGFQSLAISPDFENDGTLFVGTTFHYGTWTGVVMSEDNGETWQQLDNTGFSATALQSVPDVVISPNFVVDRQLFVGTRDGVWSISLPDNSAPKAVDDIVATDEDTAVTIGVLTNDSDIDGDSLTVTSVTQPTNGTSVINLDNTITYTPTENFNGSDTFTYAVDDGNGGTATATAILTVTPINDAPVALDDGDMVSEDGSLTVMAPGVLDNDSDIESDPLTAVLDTTTSNGNLSLNGDGSFAYTPDSNYCGADSFTYHANDGQVDSNLATVSITITCVNDAPEAFDDSNTVSEDSSVTAVSPGVLNNDTDSENTSLTAVLDTTTSNGTLNLNSDGSYTYTPNADFCGTDTFTYVANDGQLDSNSATVVLSVICFNDNPIANDDSASTNEDTAVTVTVLSNDTDVDVGDILTVASVTQPTDGSVVINGDNTIAYTPGNNFNGSDSFTYDISDGNGGSNTATVTLTVNPINDNPDAVDDNVTTLEDTAVTVDVLTNDDDIDGDTLSVTAVSTPTDGSAVLNGDNTITYTPDAEFGGSDSFTYDISDGNGGTSTATVTLTVTPVNDVPNATDDDETTNEDTAVTINILSNDSDIDGDPLTVDSATAPTKGTVIINLDDTITYTPNSNIHGNDSFNYTVSDGNGGSDTAQVTITITPINDNPDAMDDEVTTNEDTAVTIAVLANDSDLDGDSLQVTSITTAAKGNAVLNGDDTITYTPNLNENGNDSLSYTISDGNGGSATASVTITITPVNDAPDAGDDSDTTDEDVAVTITVLSNDNDIDGDSLTVTSVTTPTNGTAVINGNNTVTYTPNNDYNGNDSFSYTINDGNGDTDTAVVTLTINPVNDNPVAAADNIVTPEDTAVTLAVLANDNDVDGDTLQVSTTTTPANGTVTINLDDTVTYTPNASFNGVDTFTYTVIDGQGGTDSALVTITITAENDNPVADDDMTNTNEDTAVTIAVLANDNDIDGDTLTIDSVTQPTNGTVANNGSDVTYTPNANFFGTDDFTYTVNDGHGGSDTASVSVTVTSVNDLPVPDADVATASEDTAVLIDVLSNDSDVDGDTLTVSNVTTATNGTVSNNGTDVTYTPNLNFNGSDSFSYTADDGHGGTATALVTLSVTAVNDAPDAVDDHPTTDEDTAVTINVLANDNDIEGDLLTITAVTTPTHGTVTLNLDQTITYTPTNNYNGGDAFTYTIDDGQGGNETATVHVTVTAINDTPTVIDDAVNGFEDTAVIIDVLANDSDIDGDTITVFSTTSASHGTVVINLDNTITYTPDLNYFGTDNFTYTVDDGNGSSADGTVNLTIAAINDNPIALDDTETGAEDNSIVIAVLANDTDVDGGALSVTHVTSPTQGTVTINGDHTITYTPTLNFNGTDSFIYIVSDGNGGSDTATVTISVTAVNDAPIAEDDQATTLEDEAVTIFVLTNDNDVDGDTLTVAAITQTPTNGVVTFTAVTVQYIPDEDQCGTDTFTYQINDGNGQSDTAVVAITITCVNDTPIAIDDSATTNENTAVTINVLTNDFDVDLDTLTVISITTPLTGTAVVNGDNSITYTPNSGFSGTDNFEYTISDGNGGSATALVTIEVLPDVPQADLAVTKTDSADPIAQETLLTYTIEVTNNGPQNAAAVTLIDTLSALTTFDSYTTTQGSCVENVEGTVICDLGAIPVGNTVIVTINVLPEETGNIINTVTVSGDKEDPVLSNNSANENTTIVASNFCAGVAATIIGTPGNDVIIGTSGDDVIVGLAGKDTIDGGGGNDIICGGRGRDILYGGTGADILKGGRGRDILEGGDDNDTLYGGRGDDLLKGQANDDILKGQRGNDELWGNSGNDILYGGHGNDFLNGGSGNDELYGGRGNDTLEGAVGNDLLKGNRGNDLLKGLENDDTLYGGKGVDDLLGGNGTDNLAGGNGNDALDGGAGIDELNGNAGNDSCINGETVNNCES